MTTYNTGNPLGSTAVKDLYDNAENFDNAVNSPAPSFDDRFGKRRQTWAGMEKAVQDFLVSAGFVFLADYAAGVVLSARNQYVIRAGLPYAVADATPLPYTLTGVWATDLPNLKLIGDGSLRTDLSASSGATLVGFGAGTVADALNATMPSVGSTAAMAVAPVTWSSLYLTGGTPGFFSQVAWSSVSSISAVDTLGVYAVRSTVDPTRAWVRQTKTLTPEMFGAVGDGTTNDVAAFRLCFALVKATLIPMELGARDYRWTLTSTESWDFTSVAYTGIAIRGKGVGKSRIMINGTMTGIAWEIRANADWYDQVFEDFGIYGAFDGCLFSVGSGAMADPLNVAHFQGMGWFNSFVGFNVEALRLNFVVNSNFIGCRANCYANGLGANYGRALRLRQSLFNTFTNGSYGNADTGVDFTDTPNYGNVWLGCDLENVGFAVRNRSGNSVNNTFIGGTISLWTAYAVQSTNSDTTGSTIFKNVKFNNGAGPAVRVDPVNYVGITLQDGDPVTTPAMPGSGVAIPNNTGKTVSVRIGGGAYTVVNIAGFAMSKASDGNWTSWILPAGQAIAIGYTGTPSWSWLSPNF